jgi:hypothetical protein
MEHLRQVMTSPLYQLAFQVGFAKEILVGWPLKAIDFCPFCGSNSVEPFEPIQLPASQPHVILASMNVWHVIDSYSD